ncbi:MAG TPA: heavy metal translocating P-type ATPase, partial [Nitrolancea sp.]|nr:heavy metal translocating P-type ATPase [Nitrolancea sp.]
MASRASHEVPQAQKEQAAIRRKFKADFACVVCANDIERTLRANPHVTGVQIDYPARIVEVAYYPGMIGLAEIESVISVSGYGCNCVPANHHGPSVTGELEGLAHDVDMAAVTMNTAADRMQYEFPSTPAARLHRAALGHHATTLRAAQSEEVATGAGAEVTEEHVGNAPTSGEAGPPPGGHDHHAVSDPSLARAMEVDMRNRFIFALILTIPTVLLSSLGMNLLGIRLVSPETANWAMLVISTPIVWWAGWPFISGAVQSLRYRALNMSVLIATGVLAAWGFSVLITILAAGETFYEAAAMLVTFVLFGHWMEMKSRRGTTDALRALFDLVPPTATVIRDGTEVQVPTSELAAGDQIRLRPGDKVPVDGVVLDGTTSMDESLVTGESIPVDKSPGDEVIGGAINWSGSVLMEATKVGRDTVLAQIVSLVEEAQSSKAPGQRIADKAAAYLVVLAVGSGIITFFAWYFFGNTTALTALTFAISAIVIACPDALGLATPTAIAVGTGIGARHNILIKDAATLEGLSRVDVVVLDKTGTLTEGKPQLTDVIVSGQRRWTAGSENELLQIVASAEYGSGHPLATAIVRGAAERGLSLTSPEAFSNIAGKGVVARVDGYRVLSGNAALLADHGIGADDLSEPAGALAAAGKTPTFISIDGTMAGIIAVADTIKPSARALISTLKQAGIETVMITGDNRRTAEAVARDLGIGQVFAEVLPGEKAEYVRRLQAEGKQV